MNKVLNLILINEWVLKKDRKFMLRIPWVKMWARQVIMWHLDWAADIRDRRSETITETVMSSDANKEQVSSIHSVMFCQTVTIRIAACDLVEGVLFVNPIISSQIITCFVFRSWLTLIITVWQPTSIWKITACLGIFSLVTGFISFKTWREMLRWDS